MIRTALSSGRLVRIRLGVYLDAALWPDDAREQHLLRAAAELELVPSAVLSHESAAASWNLPSPDLQPGTSIPSASRCRVAATSPGSDLPFIMSACFAGQITKDDGGRPVTSLARTAVDLAAGRALPEALAILDVGCSAAVCGDGGTPRRSDYANPELIEEVAGTCSSTRARQGGPRPEIGIRLADPRRESAPESLSAGHFHLAGLPSPNASRHSIPRWPALPGLLLARPHPDRRVRRRGQVMRDGAAYVQEKEREQALRDLGYAWCAGSRKRSC